MFFSEPEPNLGGRTPDLGQGYALGGGSAINAMIYCRGSASVFDEWARVSGNPRLSWRGGMLDAFRATSSWHDEASITYTQPVNASVFGDGGDQFGLSSHYGSFPDLNSPPKSRAMTDGLTTLFIGLASAFAVQSQAGWGFSPFRRRAGSSRRGFRRPVSSRPRGRKRSA